MESNHRPAVYESGPDSFKMLGVSNGFPVLIVETKTWALSRESINSRGIDGFRKVLAQI